jgi:hypothetical protein
VKEKVEVRSTDSTKEGNVSSGSSNVKIDVRKQTGRTEQKWKFEETGWDTDRRAKRLQFISCSLYAFIQVLRQD